jgi:lysozyme
MTNAIAEANLTKIKATGSKGGWLPIFITCVSLMEGFAPVGHHDPIDPPGVNTIGYGHIEDVQIGDRITKIEAEELLAKDTPRYVNPIRKCLHVDEQKYPWRFAAFVDASFNLGPGTVCKSSMVRKMNAGDVAGACKAFELYTKANGKFVQGLLNRRYVEHALCLMEDDEPAAKAVLAKRTPTVPVPVPAPLPKEQPAPRGLWATIHSWFVGE